MLPKLGRHAEPKHWMLYCPGGVLKISGITVGRVEGQCEINWRSLCNSDK